MFKIYDKDMGTCIDLREIMDIKEADLENNPSLQRVLEYMNKTEPIKKDKDKDKIKKTYDTY